LIQGCGAVICKEALIETRELLKSYDGLMLAPIHDELNFEIVENKAEEFAHKAAELMKKVGNKYVSKVQMEAEITITDQWQK
jgi:DNA polymerase I-like protein with 3'-5' exonuclease and polymerase domains